VVIAVLDTNVLISGTFWLGPPKEVLHRAKVGFFQAVVSPALLAELHDVLTRKDKPFCLSTTEAKRVEMDLLSYAQVVRPKAHVAVCRDSADNRVLECALEAGANFVITGDPDLLEIGHYRGIKIVKVRAFLDSLGSR